jgi:thioredoxin 2
MHSTAHLQNEQVSYAACPKCRKLNKISISRTKTAKPVCGACQNEIDFHDGLLNANSSQLLATIRNSPLPVIVDFWAPWCGPCRMFAPTFSKVAGDLAGKAVFVKLNTEDDPQAAHTFGIRGIPAIAFFKNGTEIDRLAGAVPYENFRNWINEKFF